MTHHAVTAPSADPAYELTPERERNLRREHARAHPDGLTPISRRPCTICLLLARLSHERAARGGAR